MICVFAEVFWRKMIIILTFEQKHASFSAITYVIKRLTSPNFPFMMCRCYSIIGNIVFSGHYLYLAL